MTRHGFVLLLLPLIFTVESAVALTAVDHQSSLESTEFRVVTDVLRETPPAELFAAWPGAGPSLGPAILESLLEQGDPALAVARSELRMNGEASRTLLAIEVVSRLCGASCTDDLIRRVELAGDARVRGAALQALGSTGAPGAVGQAVELLDTDEPEPVLVAALSVVARHGTAADARHVEALRSHPSEEVSLLAGLVGASVRGLHGELPTRAETFAAPEPIVAPVLAQQLAAECRRVLEDAAESGLDAHYAAGNKHLAVFHVGYETLSVELWVDLDDLLGITPEGADGWISYWVSVKTDFSIDILGASPPFGLTLVNHQREPTVDDPLMRLQFTALSGNVAGLEVTLGNVGYGGTEEFSIDLAQPSPAIVSGSALVTSATVLRAEIHRSAFEPILGGALADESGGVSFQRVGERMLSLLVTPLGYFRTFSGLLDPANHRRLTASDDPGSSAVGDPRALSITDVWAGLDADGDGYADGWVPPSGSGTQPATHYGLKVSFQADSTYQDDFRVQVGDAPAGWIVAAVGGDGETYGKNYDVFSIEPHTRVGTHWTIACSPGAPTFLPLEIRLFRRNILWFDDLLDTVTTVVRCAQPPEPTESHLLTVEKEGSALGTVSSQPDVLVCDSSCPRDLARVDAGTAVTLAAAPETGAVFAGWGGDCTGMGSCTVIVDRERTVSATFQRPEVTALSPPAAPSDLQAVAASTTSIILSWSDRSSDEDGFLLERQTLPDGPWFRIRRLMANTESATSTHLTPDTRYGFRLTAYNEGGSSGYGGEAFATTWSAAPAVPTNLRARARSNRQIALSWDDPNSGSASYEVEQSADGASFSVVGYNGRGDTTFTRTVNPGSTRYYRVRAYRSGSGYSSYSSVVMVTACAPPGSPRHEAPYSGEDDVPLDQVLEWQGDDEVARWDLHLDTNSQPALFASGLPNPSPGDDVSFDPGGLDPGTLYYWSVVAHASCDPSLRTASDVRVFSTLGAPEPVELLHPVDGATGLPTGAVLDWANVTTDGAVLYRLFLDTVDPPVASHELDTRTVAFMELAADTTYHWQVEARSAEDPSLTSSSPVWSFTTGTAGTRTYVLDAVADAGLRDGSFSNRNYGGDPSGEAEDKAFGVGNDDNFYLDPGPAKLRGAVAFDLSEIPAGSDLVNATLTLQYAGSSGAHPSPLALYFTPYTSAWSESSITWNNRPGRSGADAVEGVWPPSGFNPTQNDLSALVDKWLDGTLSNHGFEISMPAWETESDRAAYFFQKEWSPNLAAELQVVVVPRCEAPAVPTGPSPADGAIGLASPLVLGWADDPEVGSWEVRFGPAGGALDATPTAESEHPVEGLEPSTAYDWQVEARAGCDSSLTATSPLWTFTTDACLDLVPPSLTAPASQATGQPREVSLTWQSVAGAGDYEVLMATENPPTPVVVTTSSLGATVLVEPGSTYFWRVRAIAACDPSRTTESPVALFHTAGAPSADAGIDLAVAPGEAVVVGGTPAASGGLAPYSFAWSLDSSTGAQLDSPATANPTFTAQESGGYRLRLVVTDANGFASTPSEALVEVSCDEDRLVSGQTVLGAAIFEGCRRLTVAGTVVTDGATLVLRAGERVTLGDGFRVDVGGELTVEVDPALQPSTVETGPRRRLSSAHCDRPASSFVVRTRLVD